MNIEEILPPFIDFKSTYVENCESGKNYLQNQKIVLVGLVRNLELQLEKNIATLVSFLEYAKDYKIVLFENDSQDKTKEILSKLSNNNPNIKIICRDYNRPHFGPVKDKTRTTALAEYRNILIDYIKEYYGDYDYTIMCDMDFLDVSINGIYNTFGWFAYSKNVDAVVGYSYQIKHVMSREYKQLWNYDSWAYRATWWSYLSYNTKFTDFDNMFWFGCFIPPVGSSPTKICSGFGGMGIYKTNAILSAKYEGYDCEHVCLHYNIFRTNPKFNLLINPSQIMLMN